MLGLLLGLGAALVRETLDKTVKTQDDVKAVTDTPIIGAIMRDPDAVKRPLIVEVDPRSPRAEAFRSLRTNLQFIDAANHPRTLVITSSLAGEGKSTMSANLALTMAQGGSRVCLVEADLRRPKVLDYLGLEGAVGLTDALIGRAEVFDVIQPYGGTNLWVLGAGPIPPNPSELLGSTADAQPLTHLASRFDYVVIDSPPTLPVTDAVVLSSLVDGVIVVVGLRASCSATSWRARSRAWSRWPVACSGLVLNRVPPNSAGRVRLVLVRRPPRTRRPVASASGSSSPEPAASAAASAGSIAGSAATDAAPAPPAPARRRPRPPSARTRLGGPPIGSVTSTPCWRAGTSPRRRDAVAGHLAHPRGSSPAAAELVR